MELDLTKVVMDPSGTKPHFVRSQKRMIRNEQGEMEEHTLGVKGSFLQIAYPKLVSVRGKDKDTALAVFTLATKLTTVKGKTEFTEAEIDLLTTICFNDEDVVIFSRWQEMITPTAT